MGACAPSRFVKPLNKGEKSIAFSYGGGVIEYGSAGMPLPLTSISGGYGIDSNTTAFLGLHTTSMYFNNFQIDLGVTRNVFKSEFANISVSPAINFITNIYNKETRLWPQLDINAYKLYGKNKKSYAYFGFSNWFELTKTGSNGQDIPTHWLMNPELGTVIALKRNWSINIELKQLGPFYDNRYSFIPWISLAGKYGATGFYFGFSKTF